jgi:ribosome assembly protein YihI (activator of Der GTPase)
MKITRRHIREIIKEEIEMLSEEDSQPVDDVLLRISDLMDGFIKENNPDRLQETLGKLQSLIDNYSLAEILPQNWAN